MCMRPDPQLPPGWRVVARARPTVVDYNRQRVPAVRWRFVLALWGAVLFGVADCSARADERPGLLVEPVAQYRHLSDIARGCPRRCNVDEPQSDYLGPLGLTITAGRRRAWEIDISTGVKWIDRGGREGGSEFGVRYYYMRGRQWQH